MSSPHEILRAVKHAAIIRYISGALLLPVPIAFALRYGRAGETQSAAGGPGYLLAITGLGLAGLLVVLAGALLSYAARQIMADGAGDSLVRRWRQQRVFERGFSLGFVLLAMLVVVGAVVQNEALGLAIIALGGIAICWAVITVTASHIAAVTGR